MLGRALRRKRTWFIGVPVAIVVAALLGPLLYFRFIQDDPPKRLSFADSPAVTTTSLAEVSSAPTVSTTTSVVATPTSAAVVRGTTTTRPTPASAPAAVDPVTGSWRVGRGSVVGYRVKEYVGVTANEAVGRTEKVTGDMRIKGATVETGQWVTDMKSVKSDEARRDEAYRGVMETEKYPTSTFVLRAPIYLGTVPADGVVVTVRASGDLTLHGRTRRVTFDLKARRLAGRVEALGSIPVKFSDYDIANPSNGYARTADNGELEFLLLFDKVA